MIIVTVLVAVTAIIELVTVAAAIRKSSSCGVSWMQAWPPFYTDMQISTL